MLLPVASHAEEYYNPPGNHPSEPNYIWLEAGSNLGITNDDDPAANHLTEIDHLVTLLLNQGISLEILSRRHKRHVLSRSKAGLYVPRHNPMVFFDDIVSPENPDSEYCVSHVRPYSEMEADLQSSNVARYNFITPDLCHDMHNDTGCETSDSVKNGDTWLASEVPKILNSTAYKENGTLFITWDEGENDSDGPIGMIVLSPRARGGGYSNDIHYTHSSTLRTIQELLGVTPLLGDAANSNDLSDLFSSFP